MTDKPLKTQRSLKICGIKTLEAAKEAASHGATFLGVIMVPNRQRTIDPEVAREIGAYLRTLPEPRPRLVGVFRNQSTSDIRMAVDSLKLDVVQLHGSEPMNMIQELQTPVIKRVVPSSENALDEVLALNSIVDKEVYALIDSEAGGDGKVFDWTLLTKFSECRGTYILAGGLTPENVVSALGQAGCIGVDVSGGVETDGVKDLSKIRAFLANAEQVH